MAVNFSPFGNSQIVDENGDPASGWKIQTFVAGSSTPLATYTDATGSTPHDDPIIVNALGYPTQGPIWLIEGLMYKFQVLDENDVVKYTVDNIAGINDSATTTSQWVATGATPTYISPTTFSLLGDQTSEFHLGRMAQMQTTAGTVYGKIIETAFTTLTTVTLLMTPGQALDSGLSSVSLSFLRADNQALPNPIEYIRSTVAASATATPMWSRAYGEVQDWTGVVVITALPSSPRAGATRHVFPAAGASIVSGPNITIQGNGGVVAEAGDEWVITAITLTTFYVRVVKKSGIDVNVIPNHLSGLQSSPAGGSATMPVSAGIAADSTNAVMMKLLAAFTKTTAAWAVGTGNGGKLSAAAIANNTWYHWYLIYRSDTGATDIGFDVSATAPTLPANYTHSRRIFSSLTDGSAQWVKILQYGDDFTLDVPVINFSVNNPGIAATSRTVSTPTGVRTEAKLNMKLVNTSSGTLLLVSDLAVADTTPAAGNATLDVLSFSNSAASGQVRVFTNTSSQFRTRLSISDASITISCATTGFRDTRGRDA